MPHYASSHYYPLETYPEDMASTRALGGTGLGMNRVCSKTLTLPCLLKSHALFHANICSLKPVLKLLAQHYLLPIR